MKFDPVLRGSAPVHVRVGSDLMEVESVSESLRNFGARYLQRIFTPHEIDYCLQSAAETDRRLAARFAAKEATLKVLRPNGHWLDWRNIEVVKMPGGWCELELHGAAQALRDRENIVSLSLSMSHEDRYAMAFVAATISGHAPAPYSHTS